MTDLPLHHCRILVAEDEYLIAEELKGELETTGAVVIGPVGQLAAAMALADAEASIDAAVLDINLGGTEVFPLADALLARGVIVVFSTGYDSATIPPRFAAVPSCVKPVPFAAVVTALGRALHSAKD